MIEFIGVGCKDSSGSEDGMFPTVSTEASPGDADKETSLEFLVLKSPLAFTGDTKMAYGFGFERRFGWEVLAAKQLDPI